MKSYYIEGNLEIKSNEDIYKYKVTSSYKNGSYKVSLKNKTNNHEQIILKNNEGVFVLTPSLNKSFKFQSDWPYNNSASYILSSLEDDLNTEDKTYNKNKLMYEVKANYPNNKDLTKERIYFNKNYLPEKVEVLDKDGNIQIKMNYNKLEINKKFDKKYFDLKSCMTIARNNTKAKEVSSTLEDIFPMYLPKNTKLTQNEKIKTKTGERVIMTFSGENPFTIVEEKINNKKDMQVVETYGDLEVIPSSVSSLNDDMIVWSDNGKEYYVMSDKLSKQELRSVASSISSLPISK